MTFEEFEKAVPRELRETAKTCFNSAHQHGHSWGGTAALLLEAQFYLAEMDRRHDATIARRDFRMELAVIALIALELAVSVWGMAISAHCNTLDTPP